MSRARTGDATGGRCYVAGDSRVGGGFGKEPRKIAFVLRFLRSFCQERTTLGEVVAGVEMPSSTFLRALLCLLVSRVRALSLFLSVSLVLPVMDA